MTRRNHLVALDTALARLRRLWESPEAKRHFRERVDAEIELGTIRTLRAIDGSSGDEMGIMDVAAALNVDKSTASRLVHQAVRAGLVEQTVSPVDRRRCLLVLTEPGASLLESATALRTDLLDELTGDWSDDEVAQLAALLDRLARAAWEWTADDARV